MSEPNQILSSDYDIVFVNPAHHGADYYAPIGVGMLSTLIRQQGYRTIVLDFQRDVVRGAIPWPEGFLRPPRNGLQAHQLRYTDLRS